MPLLINVLADDWSLEITGKLAEVLPGVNVSATSTVRVTGTANIYAYKRDDQALVPVSSGDHVEPLLFENTTYHIYFRSRAPGVALQPPPASELQHRYADLSHYTINFGNEVGFAEFEVVQSHQRLATIQLEVFPRKIDYRRDYIHIRDDVAAIARNLVMTLQARTFGTAQPTPEHKPTLAEWLSLLQGYHNTLVRAVRSIVANPHSALEKERRVVSPDRARRVERRSLELILRKAGPRSRLQHNLMGIELPRRVEDTRRRVTYDTSENRYLKAVLQEVRHILQQLLRVTSSGDEDADQSAERKFLNAARPQLRQMLNDLHGLLCTPLFREICAVELRRPRSFVYHRHPHYAAAARVARLLGGGLTATDGPLRIGIKNIALLYEYWCFLKLVELLRTRCNLEQQSLIRLRRSRVVISLKKGKESTVVFRDPVSGKRLKLVYNRLFTPLPTIDQQPDNVIQLADDDDFYLFDAKYRLEFSNDYQRLYNGVGPMPGDINAMHRYRDAIVVPSMSGGGFTRGVVRGAIVLFPWHDEAGYRSHALFASVRDVDIGGLPFLPGCTHLVEEKLAELLYMRGMGTPPKTVADA